MNKILVERKRCIGAPVKSSEKHSSEDARANTHAGIDRKKASDSPRRIGMSIDKHHVGDRNVGGRGQKREGGGGERVIGSDGLEDDADLNGECHGLEEKFAEERQAERERCMWKNDEGKGEETAQDAVGEIKRSAGASASR